MGGSSEIPNVGPVQALKMGRNGSENGGQLGDPKFQPIPGSENGAENGGQR